MSVIVESRERVGLQNVFLGAKYSTTILGITAICLSSIGMVFPSEHDSWIESLGRYGWAIGLTNVLWKFLPKMIDYSVSILKEMDVNARNGTGIGIVVAGIASSYFFHYHSIDPVLLGLKSCPFIVAGASFGAVFGQLFEI